MNVKAVLINPPVPDQKAWVREGRCQQWDIWGAMFPPLSLALISTQLVKEGIETRIIDSGPMRLAPDDILRICRDFNPDLAVLATTTPTLHTDLGWFAPELKAALPRIRIAVIGIHVSVLSEKVINDFVSVDYVIRGEPEITARELAVSILVNKDNFPDQVKGITYRNSSRTAVINPPRAFLENIDELGMPDWGKVDLGNYRMPVIGRPFSLIVFARGCPFNCKFCATHVYNGSKVRRRSVSNIIEEIKFNISLGVCDFLFWTEQMTLDKQYLTEFLDKICREGLQKKIRWVCNSRVDCADQDLFVRMKAAGCWQIAFGLEFGDDRILKLANKGGNSSIKQGRLAVEMADKAGLVADGHFIMGYPGEDVASLDKTIEFACSLPLTFAHFYTASPFPGAQLYDEAIANKWIDTEDSSFINQDIVSLKLPGLSPEIVAEKVGKAYRVFYSRPQTAWRILSMPHSPGEFFNLAKLVARFFAAKFIPRPLVIDDKK